MQLFAIKCLRSDAVPPVFDQPNCVVDAQMRNNGIADSKGGEFSIEARLDRLSGEFRYHQMFHWRPRFNGGGNCRQYFRRAWQQIA